MAKIKVGDRFESNNYGWFEIVEYNKAKDIMIKFENTGYITSVEYSNIRKGGVKDPTFPSVHGKGYVGECGYKPWCNGKHTKAYSCWVGMLQRCYSEEFQDKHPTYRGCSVHVDWYNFQNFAKYYEDNYREGFHLDKDLLFKGNKIYSPETCVLVPRHINNFILSHKAKRGKYKVGVVLHNLKSYQVRVGNKYLGVFPTEEEAYQEWLSVKLQQALEYKPEMDEIDERIYPNVVEIIKEM